MHRTHSHAAFAWLAAALLVAPAAHAGDVTVKLDSGSAFRVEGSGAIERLRVDEATGNVSRNGALFVHTTGVASLFVGEAAGNPATPGQQNTGFGVSALGNNSGDWNSAFGRNALAWNTTGGRNTAFGANALITNTSGNLNTAVGWNALLYSGSGVENSAFGAGALRYGGSGNSAFGKQALYKTTGNLNVGFGAVALFNNTTGTDNVAVGTGSLASNTTGSRNLAFGNLAGNGQTTGNDNIYLASTGVAGESGQIRIGTSPTHTQATIAGIHGKTSAGGIAVLVNASGTLGTTTSSARFKQDVRDMGDASDLLMRLRPVTFRYLETEVGPEEAKTLQYGLIAEEVAKVSPELVAPDADGRPYSVKYHELPALLLNEVQQQQRTIATLEARIAELEREVAR